MPKIKAILKLIAFAVICILVVPTQGLFVYFHKGPTSFIVPRLWHDIARRIFGIKIKVSGEINKSQQTIFMSNHLSYLDIPVIGSVLKGSFVAKSEVSGWPLFGFLATLQQTAFIQRKRSKIAQEKDSLQGRIARGDSLIIFAEGTSTSGFEVLPFKSSLFALALHDQNDGLYIQPVTVKLLCVDGQKPQTKEERDIYAWPRDVDIDLHHHLWRFAKTSGATIELVFHPAIAAKDYNDRKTLAKLCHDNVSKGLEIRNAA